MKICFITLNKSWGGSEELWSRTAESLAKNGHVASAIVPEELASHRQFYSMRDNGVNMHLIPGRFPIWHRLLNKFSYNDRGLRTELIDSVVRHLRPSVVVISAGRALPAVELLELCVNKGLAYVCIGQSNSESRWPDDGVAARYRKALPEAVRCYFVSDANKRLVEKQIGMDLANAEIVRNPFNVRYNTSIPWPSGNEETLKIACVGRLHPPSKGQDILLEALAAPIWRKRDWRLTFYGKGPCEEGLLRLINRLSAISPEISRRTVFAGFTERIDTIWRDNHLLAMPSRYEGLPLAMVEAMLCGRAVVATNVAGHAEIIENDVTGFLAKSPTVDDFDAALEKAWERRQDLKNMGALAAKRIRELIPKDPVDVFSREIATIAEGYA